MVDKKLFLKNSFSGLIQKVIIAVVTFMAIPIFIRIKGAEMYGIFATIGALGELGRLTELGFNKTLVKFLSIQGKTKESSQDIIVAAMVMLSLIILLTVGLFFARDFILLNILKIPHLLIVQSKLFYYYAISANALLLFGSLFSSVIESQRYIYRVSFIQLIYSLLYWGLIIVSLLLGFGLHEIGVSIFLAALIWFILTVGVMRSIWGRFDLTGFSSYTKVGLKKLTSYSIKVYISSLLGLFEEFLLRILVSNLFGIIYAGYLDVGIRIKSQLFRLLQTIVYPLFQLFSEIKDKSTISVMMQDIEEKLFLIMTAFCIIFASCTGSFIHIWLGTSESAIIVSTIIITVGALLLQLTIMPTVYYLTIYHPTILLVTQIVAILVNVLVLYIGHFFMGYKAIYFGIASLYLTQLIMRLYYQKRFLKCVPFGERKYFFNYLISTIILIISGVVLNFIFHFSNMMNLIITPIVLGIFTVILYKYLYLIKKEDLTKYLGDFTSLPILSFLKK